MRRQKRRYTFNLWPFTSKVGSPTEFLNRRAKLESAIILIKLKDMKPQTAPKSTTFCEFRPSFDNDFRISNQLRLLSMSAACLQYEEMKKSDKNYTFTNLISCLIALNSEIKAVMGICNVLVAIRTLPFLIPNYNISSNQIY